MGALLQSWAGQVLNGLVLGNVYALMAAGLALVFGAARLVNFAQGSVYMAGSYAAWFLIARLGWPLWAALPGAAIAGAALGLAIEALAVRPYRRSGGVAPLLATIGAGMMLDGLAEVLFTPTPRSFPNLPFTARYSLGPVSIGGLDLLILCATALCALGLLAFLKLTRAGRGLRAAAQDLEAALQMGVRAESSGAAAFAIASALGALAGALVGLYYNFISPSVGFQAGLKGFTACVLGGLGGIGASMAGGLVLGLGESLGVALFGSSYRGLVSYGLLLAILFLRPEGLFGRRGRGVALSGGREIGLGSFLPLRGAWRPSKPLAAALALAALALPLANPGPYVLQVLAGAWISALFALSLSFVAGGPGIMSLGHAGLMAIGAYASGLLTLKAGWPFVPAFLSAGLIAAVLGAAIAFPALRLKGHYIAIAMLGLGEIVNQVILNWDSLTQGALGLAGIPAPRLLALEITSAGGFYYLSLAVLGAGFAALAAALRSPLGRTLRALREDETAAVSLGIGARSYKTLAFAIGAFFAGLAGALTAHLYTYVSHETFGSSYSILGVTMAILGGLGNLWGALLGALSLSALPELLRFAQGGRGIVYGAILLLALRFRPQGLLGSE